MTVQKARTVFATHMKAARTRKLTTYELNQLSEARQVLRHARKPAMNPHTRFFRTREQASAHIKKLAKHHVYAYAPEYDSRKDMWYIKTPTSKEIDTATHLHHIRSRRKQNPGTGKKVLIYGAVNRIYATKTQGHQCDPECARNGHRYFHDFKSKPKMYGLPDGSILIKS